MAVIFKWLRVPWRGFTYLLTALFIVFAYPYILFSLEDHFDPPPPDEVHCGLPRFAFMFCNIIILLPISMFVQALFNRIFLRVRSAGAPRQSSE